jgi:hypothetical protein
VGARRSRRIREGVNQPRVPGILRASLAAGPRRVRELKSPVEKRGPTLALSTAGASVCRSR